MKGWVKMKNKLLYPAFFYVLLIIFIFNTISFAQEKKTKVTEIKKHPRIGISAISGNKDNLEKFGVSWYFNWTHIPVEGVDLDFMPLIAGYTRGRNVSDEYLANLEKYIKENPDKYPDGTIWMIGNEIGYPPQHDYRTPEQYAEDYHRCYKMLKKINPSFKVAVGATILSQNEEHVLAGYIEGKGGLHYIKRVRDVYEKKYGQQMPLDYYTATAHVLDAHGTDVELFKQQIIRYRKFLASMGQQDKKLIITEFGCTVAGPSDEQIQNFMKQSLEFVANAKDDKIGCTEDDGRLVQRWAWFTLHGISYERKLQLLGNQADFIKLNQTSVIDEKGNISELGKLFQQCINNSF